MSYTWTDIGPERFGFGRSAVNYLSNSPGPSDKVCLEQFFRDLQRHPVKALILVTSKSVTVSVCNHIVIFTKDWASVLDVVKAKPMTVP